VRSSCFLLCMMMMTTIGVDEIQVSKVQACMDTPRQQASATEMPESEVSIAELEPLQDLYVCPYCEYGWYKRVAEPRMCPRCKRRLDKERHQ
jgi:hypothetical protein